MDHRSWQRLLQPAGRCARSGAGHSGARERCRQSAKHPSRNRELQPGLHRVGLREPAGGLCSRLQSLDDLRRAGHAISWIQSAWCSGRYLRRDAPSIWPWHRDECVHEYALGMAGVGPKLAQSCVVVRSLRLLFAQQYGRRLGFPALWISRVRRPRRLWTIRLCALRNARRGLASRWIRGQLVAFFRARQLIRGKPKRVAVFRPRQCESGKLENSLCRFPEFPRQPQPHWLLWQRLRELPLSVCDQLQPCSGSQRASGRFWRLVLRQTFRITLCFGLWLLSRFVCPHGTFRRTALVWRRALAKEFQRKKLGWIPLRWQPCTEGLRWRQ